METAPKTSRKRAVPQEFTDILLKLASPERIKEWSYGEVTKPETINYRTQRSEKHGLFDEKIFGPDKDFECYCGKYKGNRYRGIVCEKCGVEITRSIVRRERMGHVDLATPVSHIWFLRTVPSRLGQVLGMSLGDLERVIYFAGYIVTKVHEQERARVLRDIDSEYRSKVATLQDEKSKEALKELLTAAKKDVESIQEGVVLDEVQYHAFAVKYGTIFESSIGAEAIYNLLKSIDLKVLVEKLEKRLEDATAAESEKLNKRLSLTRSMLKSGIRPEWMFLTRIPIIPPGLRPMVALDGGRYATSDVNDLYRRVINRNNRLKKLMEIGAPEVILRNEKRILQEAVDALIDNSVRQGSSTAGSSLVQRRQLKSLADNLKSKRGLFRQNLLGKRVDYSGRSVIVVGPNLKLSQCGLPKHMALELFKPFVISQILQKELAFNIRGATKLIEDGVPEVWAILEDVIKDKYVLLNRAPTLHRLGIQAFQPVLIEGNAIQVHPMVCTAFNADFDGDQMAVHVPLSAEAQLEAREIMAADRNILKPGSGDPTVSAKLLDIALGVYWMTKVVAGEKGEDKIFASPQEAILAYNFNTIGIRAKIKVMPPADSAKYAAFEGKIFETTVGRILFNNVLPIDYPFNNQEIGKGKIPAIVDDLIQRYGINQVPEILDRVKAFGFKYVTMSGVTWGIDDVRIPEKRGEVIKASQAKADTIIEQFDAGLLSQDEKHRKILEVWYDAKNQVEKMIPDALEKDGSISDMVKSGARGSYSQITMMAGMKGLIASTKGEVLEFPILSNSKEGLSPIEYFITTHGSRKGLTDTALNTAKAGYLTRKLFVVAQDVIVSEDDCGTKKGIILKREKSAIGMNTLQKSVRGRILAEDVMDTEGKLVFKRGHLVSKDDAERIEKSGTDQVTVRSPIACEAVSGLCARCYGVDLGREKLVEVGEAVGTVAAQAIGEPGTQLTMRTFHAGGAASASGDITQGLPRVEEIFEKRNSKNPAVVSHVDGVVTEIREEGKERTIVVLPEVHEKEANTKTKSRKKVKASDTEYSVPAGRTIFVKVGDSVTKGEILTDGPASIDEIFQYGGREKAQHYIITEVTKPYDLQGETISRKHIEVIVRQMFSRAQITDPGSTPFTVGETVEVSELDYENKLAKERGGELAKSADIVMGITEVSLTRKSFLAAASFQYTNRVLIQSAVKGSRDTLKGLMENVIIGRLIPAGTGYKGSNKSEIIGNLQSELAKKAAEKAALEQTIADQAASEAQG
jgi:DNA-directed RNA polymerase subunit beta'